MRNLIIILLLFITVSSYSQINTIKVSGVDTAAMLLPYKVNYPRQAISLVFTTTGSSGAATGTYNNGAGVFTINVPQYSGGSSYTVADSRLVFSANTVIKDTSTLVYDRTNGNVAIGLTTAGQKLDVNGQLRIGTGDVSQIYGRSDAGQLSIFSTTTPVKGAYFLLNSANPSGFSDSGSALLNYGDYTAVAPTNSLLRFRYATNGRAYDNGSFNANGYFGVNTNSAHNPLSVEPRKYTTGQASQSGLTVTGVGTSWTSDMIGDYFKWPNQTFPADRITAVGSTTSITLAGDQPAGNASPSDYEILKSGVQVTPTGRLGIGISSPLQALHVHGNVQIDSLSTGSGSDSLLVVNTGVLKKIASNLKLNVSDTATMLANIYTRLVRNTDSINSIHSQIVGLASTFASYLPLAGGTMTGNLLATDNAVDLGASGATRFRSAFLGTSLVSPLILGGTGTTQTLTYQTTSGVGATGADHVFKVGNNGATEAMRIFNNGTVGVSGNLYFGQPAVDAYISRPTGGVVGISSSIGTRINGTLYIGNVTTAATSTLHTSGSFATAYTATATSLTATISHNVIVITATGQTITLPTAVGITGRFYTIKLTASGTGTVTTTSSQTIDGSTTYSLSAQYKYVTVQSDGANWNIIGNN